MQVRSDEGVMHAALVELNQLEAGLLDSVWPQLSQIIEQIGSL